MNIKLRIKNSTLFGIVLSFYKNYFQSRRSKFGFIHPTAFVRYPIIIKGIENVYLNENASILSGALILATRAKFIIKRNSGAAEGLTVVTGNHVAYPGLWLRDVTDEKKTDEADKDVVVEEDVWIAANVTLLSGVTVGRGCSVGAGSVVRNNLPPYSIVVGNPAKVIGFRFSPGEIVEHEKALYEEKDRIPFEVLEKNYNKYFRSRIKEIKNTLRL